jgi:hypothetical protein
VPPPHLQYVVDMQVPCLGDDGDAAGACGAAAAQNTLMSTSTEPERNGDVCHSKCLNTTNAVTVHTYLKYIASNAHLQK